MAFVKERCGKGFVTEMECEKKNEKAIVVFVCKGMNYFRVMALFNQIGDTINLKLQSDIQTATEEWSRFPIVEVCKGLNQTDFFTNLRNAIIANVQTHGISCPEWFTEDWISKAGVVFNDATVVVGPL